MSLDGKSNKISDSSGLKAEERPALFDRSLLSMVPSKDNTNNPDLTIYDLWGNTRDTRANTPPQFADALAQAPPTDRSRVRSDSTGAASDRLELRYGDPNFDAQLARTDYKILKITGIPKDVQVKGWADDKGFFFWFKNGHDNKAHHHMPRNLQYIEVDVQVDNSGKQFQTTRIKANELRYSAIQGLRAENEAKKDPTILSMPETTQAQKEAKREAINRLAATIQFASTDNSKRNPTDFVSSGVSLAAGIDGINKQLEDMAKEAALADPSDPYPRLLLSQIYLAQAFQPYLQNIKNVPEYQQFLGQVRNGRVDPQLLQRYGDVIQTLSKNLGNKECLSKIDAAIGELDAAVAITQKYGDVRLPSAAIQMPLAPFAFFSNRDAYWYGARDQAELWRLQLRLARNILIPLLKSVELPPALPPR